jgi:hypothetical protein
MKLHPQLTHHLPEIIMLDKNQVALITALFPLMENEELMNSYGENLLDVLNLKPKSNYFITKTSIGIARIAIKLLVKTLTDNK